MLLPRFLDAFVELLLRGLLLGGPLRFRLALASYRDRSPVGSPTAPATLDDLLQDPRFPMAVRHLRRAWRDPLTNDAEWALVKVADRIVGIHSRSKAEPLRTAFEPRDATFSGAASYAQWVFEASATAPLAPRPRPSCRRCRRWPMCGTPAPIRIRPSAASRN